MRRNRTAPIAATLSLATLGLAADVRSQSETRDPALGWRIAKLTNPSKTGAKVLNAVIHYPVIEGGKTGRNAPLAVAAAKLPVIVFLHGFGASGGMMVSIGRHFAEHGYIAVLTNTTRTNRKMQAINAKAFFAALEAANKDEGSFLHGRLDMERVGISGHSMGGGNTMRVLGSGNPGYKAGFCFAPWTAKGAGEADYVRRFAPSVIVPMAIVHGIKDRVLPWKRNAQKLYEAVEKSDAFKAFWVLGEKATHVNVAVPSMLSPKNDPTFRLCAGLATGFFDRFLKGKTKALDGYLVAEKQPEGVQELRTNQ